MSRLEELAVVLKFLPRSKEVDELKSKLEVLQSNVKQNGLKAGGTFEWVDSVLVKVKCLLNQFYYIFNNFSSFSKLSTGDFSVFDRR
jgi:hypothetical protein